MRRWSYILTLFMMGGLLGCEGEVDEFVVEDIDPPGTIRTFHQRVQDLAHNFEISSTATAWIQVGPAFIEVPADAFESQGMPYDGQVDLEVIFIDDLKYAMLYDIGLVDTEGNPLVGYGIYKIMASSPEGRLNVRADRPIQLYLPPVTDASISNYSTDSTGLNVRDWYDLDADVSIASHVVRDSSGEREIEAMRLPVRTDQWHSIGQPLQGVLTSDVCLDLFESNTMKNTRVFFFGRNAGVLLPVDIGIEGTCKTTPLPRNVSGSLLLFAHKGDERFEAGSQTTTFGNSLTRVEVLPIGMTIDEILHFIEEL